MKKFIIASVMLLSVSITYAQLNFGVKAGFNSSLSLNNSHSLSTGDYNLNSVKSDLSNGFQAGVFARFGFKKIYFQPEFLYNMGKKDYTMTLQDAQNNDVQLDKRVTISTLEVPLLLGYKLLDLKLINLRAFAGPKLRFNAGSSLDYNVLAAGGSITAAQLSKDIKAAQLGLEAGIGVDILMFTLDARYNLIKDMYQTKLDSKIIDDIPANTFVISLGYKFF
jgi:opacity protein-like surface antigen